MSIDSALNHVIIVADGQKLEDNTFPIPGGAQPPKNLAGKLLLLKFWLGFWFQSQNKVSQLNIFSRHLTLAEMVSRTAGEDCRLGNGDYLAWESSQWNLKGKAKFVSPVTAEDLCRRVSKIQLFTAPTQFDQCVDHCEKIQGGRLPTVRSLTEQEALYGRVDEVLYVNEAKQKESGTMSFSAWVPINQINGTWVDLYNKKPMADLIWAKGNPTPESCALYIIPWKGLGSYTCKVQIKAVFLFCPCHFPDSPRLTLRGLCPDSNLDQSYVPRNDPVTGWVYYYGTFKTIAKLDGLEGKWEMQSAFFNTTASTDAKPSTFILGKHSWNIGGDSQGCHSGQPYTTKLKLTGCTEGDFTCDDGQCVRMEERCNQVPDCRDESDENGCQLVAFKNNYKKEIPPIGRAKDGRAIPANVDISITLMKVVEIEEIAGGELLGRSSISLWPPQRPPLSWSSRQTWP